MRSFRLVPDGTHIRFMRYQYWAMPFRRLILLTLILVPLKGLNFGVDFRGGLLIEARVPGTTADLGAMRVLGISAWAKWPCRRSASPTDVLIRVQRQEGGEEAQLAAVEKVKSALNQSLRRRLLSPRRVGRAQGQLRAAVVGRAGRHLLLHRDLGLRLVPLRMAVGVGTILALIHDVTTIGIYCLFDLEFNLTRRRATDDRRLFSQRYGRDFRPGAREPAQVQDDAAERPPRPLDQRDAGAHHDDLADHAAGAGRAVRLWRPGDPRLHHRHDLGRGDRHLLDVYISTPVLVQIGLRREGVAGHPGP